MKQYQKPKITRIKLITKEAVLQFCRSPHFESLDDDDEHEHGKCWAEHLPIFENYGPFDFDDD